MNSKIPRLAQVFQRDFLIGAAVNARTIHSQKQLLIDQFNSITAENEMKFVNVQPEEGVFTFEAADRIAAFARENGKQLRGHTLVWHNQTPDWLFRDKNGNLTDKATLYSRMKTHIETVMKRYAGQIYAWDVVNEVISDEGSDPFRASKWLEIAGSEYIVKAFEFAHEADSNALLFYNDYNESNPEKREKIYAMAKSLVEQGVPIHGIGLQAHWNVNRPAIDDIRAAIERYASLGLQLHITEMDVSVYEFDDRRTDLKEPTAEMAARQEERYEAMFKLFREYRDVIACVTFWGAADDYTWLDNFPVRSRKNWPFLFDTNQQPKQAFWKVVSQVPTSIDPS